MSSESIFCSIWIVALVGLAIYFKERKSKRRNNETIK